MVEHVGLATCLSCRCFVIVEPVFQGEGAVRYFDPNLSDRRRIIGLKMAGSSTFQMRWVALPNGGLAPLFPGVVVF